MSNINNLINFDLEKARSGIYKDTKENRSKKRVGQRYGSDVQKEDYKEFYQNQTKLHSQYKEFVENIANEFNAVALVAPPKEPESLERKINDLDGNYQKIKDILRSTIVVDRERIPEIVEKMSKKFDSHAEKNFAVKAFVNFEGQGYHGVNFVVEFQGYAVEIQINTPVNLALKDNNFKNHPMLKDTYEMLTEAGIETGVGHKYYEKMRSSKDSNVINYYNDLTNEYYDNRLKFLDRDKVKKSNFELSSEEQAYETIKKAFDEGLVDTETFLKAEKNIIAFREKILKSASKEYSDFIVLNESVDKILLLNRSKIDEMGSGEWCLPGGTVEQGENIEAAAYRELEEETGLEISPLNSHYVDTYINEDGSKTHYFQTKISENAMIYLDNSEHYNYTWASIDKLDMYDMIFNLEERISNILMPKPKKIKKGNSLIDRLFSYVVDVSEKLTGNKIDKSEIINKDEIIERQFNEGVISAENFFKYLNDQSYKEIEDMSGDKQLKHKLKLENTLGRTRSSMPQIDSDNIDDVVIHFSQNSPDAKVEKININVNDLRFSQNEIDDEKVNNLMKRSNPLSINNRFLVAGNKKEGFYVIDGHHRLAAIANLAEDSLNIPCYLIKLTPKEAIRRLNLMKITSKESVEKSEEKITIIGGEEVSKSYIKELYEKYF